MSTARARTTEEVIDWLVSTVSEILEISPGELDIRRPFTYYGIGSTELVMIIGDLESWIGSSFPSSLPFDYPNIESLAQHLGADSEDAVPFPPAEEAAT